MATIANQQGQYFANLINVYYRALGCEGSVSTLDVYRRTTAGPSDDLGIPNDGYQKIYSAQNCAICGIKETREGAFEMTGQGPVQHPLREVVTAQLDIQAGDSVILALDGLGYGVDRATRKGMLMVLLLDHAISQV